MEAFKVCFLAESLQDWPFRWQPIWWIFGTMASPKVGTVYANWVIREKHGMVSVEWEQQKLTKTQTFQIGKNMKYNIDKSKVYPGTMTIDKTNNQTHCCIRYLSVIIKLFYSLHFDSGWNSIPKLNSTCLSAPVAQLQQLASRLNRHKMTKTSQEAKRVKLYRVIVVTVLLRYWTYNCS